MKFSIVFMSLIQFSHASELSFEQALDQIMGRDTDIKGEQKLLESSEIETFSKKMAFAPDLTVSSTKRKTYNTESSTKGLSATSTINISKFGADYYDLKAGEYFEISQKSTVDDTFLKSQSEAIETLLNYIENHYLVDILKRQYAVNLSSLKTANNRYKKGFSSRQDVQKIRVDADNTLATLEDAEIKLERVKASLKTLIGKDVVKVSWPWINFFKKKLYLSMLKEKEKISNVPSYTVIENRMLANKALSTSLKRSMLPTLDLSVGYGYTDTIGVKDYEWTSLLTLTIPLFNKYSDYSSYKTQAARSLVNEYQLIEKKRNIVSNWTSDKKNFLKSLKTAKNREKTLRISRKLYQDNFKRFRNGKITVNDLLVDQNRLLRSEQLNVHGWHQVHQKFYGYCHSLGKKISSCL
jgi:outer membrane protein TolC